jgi:hypothetical protein
VDVTIVPAQLAVEPMRMYVDDVRVGGPGVSDRSVQESERMGAIRWRRTR